MLDFGKPNQHVPVLVFLRAFSTSRPILHSFYNGIPLFFYAVVCWGWLHGSGGQE